MAVGCEFYGGDGLKRVSSLENLNPTFSSSLRKTSFKVATFNLVATIVGGGVLSLPLAFAKTGLVLATIMMIFSALITEFGLYLLCSCARRTGAVSYMDVARKAFGPPGEILMTAALLFFLCGVLVAYDVLLMGIFAPIARDILEVFFNVTSLPENFDSTVLLVILILVSPLMLQRDLYALRHICYVGFTSVCVIVLTMAVRAVQRNSLGNGNESMEMDMDMDTAEQRQLPKVEYFTTDLGDAMFAFPIIVLSFLCAFNVVEVQGALQSPTRSQLKSVLRTSISLSFVLFEAFGLVGYFYAYDACQGNIFLNFDAADPLIIVGRLGMGLTLMFGTPVVTLPCREAFLSIIPQVMNLWKSSNDDDNDEDEDLSMDPSEVNSLLTTQHSITGHSYLSINHDVEHCTIHTAHESSTFVNKENFVEDDSASDSLSFQEDSNVVETFTRVVATFLITSSTYFAAVAVPGVAVVWAILGSSLGMLIGFIVPCACYLKIRRHKGLNRWTNVGALALFLFSTAVAVACTAHAIADMKKH